MKVLVTGAAGQLGLHLVSELQKVNWIDLLIANKEVLDVADGQVVQNYLEKHLPDVVINTAAFTSVDLAEELSSEANKVNSVGAANLAEASAKINSVIIHVSTDYVFSGSETIPYTESDYPNPINLYGKTKLDGEQAVARLNPKYIIVRTSWLFSGLGKNFYLTVANLLKSKNKISVVSDQVGAPTCALDVARLIMKALCRLNQQKSLDWGIYHYAGYPFVSWFDFAIQIQKALYPSGSQCEVIRISSENYKSSAKRPLYSCLDSSKACRYFGVKPSDWLTSLNKLTVRV